MKKKKVSTMDRARKILADWQKAENIDNPADWLEDAMDIISAFVGGEEE